MVHDPGSWELLRRRSRLKLLEMHYQSKVGHIGGNLSCLDMLLCLHHEILRPEDQFLLSKGHSAGAFYVALWTLDRLSDQDLRQFHRDNTRLSGHPPTSGIDEVLFATGSLGHGLSLAAGLAMGKRFRGEPGRVYCLMSDGEWNEGSCWEALMFARHQELQNLTVLVDHNGLQGFGSTRAVCDLHPFADKFRTFGVSVQEIDGHDHASIWRALAWGGEDLEVIVATTRKGCGVSFMEDRMEWHYLPLNDEEYHQAVREVEEECVRSSVVRW